MCYNAVVDYANEMLCSFSLFCLPAFALPNLVEDVMEVKRVDGNDDDDDFITPPLWTQQKSPPKE